MAALRNPRWPSRWARRRWTGWAWWAGDFHTDKEWIDLTSLTPRLYLFTRLLMEMGTNPPKR